MSKVSLIVAAYNVEPYIKKCLFSLINQTFKGIEIIVVNDGSTDNTLMEIYDICFSNPQIKVIDKKNEGVMSARKTGYDVANGEYILFIDGDDWICPTTVEFLYKKAKEKEYDIVCYKFFSTDGQNIIENKQNHTEYPFLSGDDFLILTMTNKIMPSLWSKLIKKEFIHKNNVTFPIGIAKAQDLAFSCALGIHFPKACVINEKLYYYFISRSTSVTNTISPLVLEVEKATQFIRQELLSNGIYESYKDEFEYLAFKHNFNKDVFYINKNKFSKQLYRKWKILKINIKENKYYKEFMRNEPLKARVISNMILKNYFIGTMFFKIYITYTKLSAKKNKYLLERK